MKWKRCDVFTSLRLRFENSLQGAVKQISGSVGNAVDCVEMQPWPWIEDLMVKIPWWNDGFFPPWFSSWPWIFRLRSGKKHFYGNQGTGRNRPGLRSWNMSKTQMFESMSMSQIETHMFFFAMKKSLHFGSILVDFDVELDLECMEWIWTDLDSTCERDVGDVCLNVFLDWFVDSCWFVPRWFSNTKVGACIMTKSFWLWHKRNETRWEAQEFTSVAVLDWYQAQVQAARGMRWCEHMWTTCFSACSVWTQFYSSSSRRLRNFNITSGSLTSLLGMCAFQVCRKQCCVLHFRGADLRNPCKPYLSKTSKMMLQLIPPHVLFICFILCSTAIFGASIFLQAQSPVIAGVKLSFFKGMMRPIEQDWSRPGSQEKLKNRQGRFWNSILPILLFDSLSR